MVGRAAVDRPQRRTALTPVSGYRVVTFSSTHHAMAGEDALHAREVDFEVVPTPKEVSAGCGLALRVRDEDLPQAQAALEEADVPYGAIVAVAGV